MKSIRIFYLIFFPFPVVEFSIYLNKRVDFPRYLNELFNPKGKRKMHYDEVRGDVLGQIIQNITANNSYSDAALSETRKNQLLVSTYEQNLN